MGHTVALLGDGREFVEKVLAEKPDFVFNFAEGHGISRSREASVPAVLEMLGIPFTGSDPFTMAVTLDKDCARSWSPPPASRSPQASRWSRTMPLDEHSATLQFPLVVKPAWEGSSKGIRNNCLVNDVRELPDVVALLRHAHPQTILLEEFIAGEELTVGMFGNARSERSRHHARLRRSAKTERFIYSLEMKRDYHGCL